tara:strand:+ start:23 stop:991 length:969 start_codon:yes stop_codon:yes gene_type:complete
MNNSYKIANDLNKGQNPLIIILNYYLQFAFAWLKVIILGLLTYVVTIFLTWLPDIDLMLLSILHHRSIITHSILIPFLLTFLFVGKLSWVPSLFYTAVGIHLGADLLSPSVGFGAIWFPEPIKFSLGEMSKIWILINIVGAFFLAYHNFPERYVSSLFWGTLFAGIMYGLQNENSAISAVVISTFFVSVSIWQKNRLKISFVPSEETAEIRIKRSILLEQRRAYQEYRRSFSFSKRIFDVLLSPIQFFQFLLSWAKVIEQHPKKTALISIIFVALVSLSYFSGANIAVEGVKNGVWVLHSSGGWILQNGGKYIAGTLTNVKP